MTIVDDSGHERETPGVGYTPDEYENVSTYSYSDDAGLPEELKEAIQKNTVNTLPLYRRN